MRALVLILILIAAPTVDAAPAGARTRHFEPARPGFDFVFPRDHGAHENFRTEWWYYTGHLQTEQGHSWGFELTFFRVGSPLTPPSPPTEWDLQDFELAHFALTDIDHKRFRYAEKLNRSSPFLAGARTGTLNVFNEGWSARAIGTDRIRLEAAEGKDRIDLVLTATKPPAVHGIDGVSVKAEGEDYASHYYSLSRLSVAGTISTGGQATRCHGLAWMDHEFGGGNLRESQLGWDWFALQLDNGTELMLYQIRRANGSADVTSAGSFILDDGSVVHLTHDQYRIETLGRWTSPHSTATYPMGWHLTVPSLDLDLLVEEQMKDQELMTPGSTRVTYWEGAVRTSGRIGASAVSGIGYVEMTGYDRRAGDRER